MSALDLYGPWTEKNRKANRQLARFNVLLRKQKAEIRARKADDRVIGDAMAST